VESLKALLASQNEHKLAELRHALPEWELNLLAADEFPAEEGDTYYENARAKALFGRAIGARDAWAVGEDSGIEVVALGGAPGLKSARWAGGAHVERVLQALDGVEGDRRRARYVCELVAVSPDGIEVRGTGVLQGRIAEAPTGTEGFGFDPVFIPEGEQQTVAELGDAWKAENSHRARAARALQQSIPGEPRPDQSRGQTL
jgi:XTP/dITP diphosphohydrolase